MEAYNYYMIVEIEKIIIHVDNNFHGVPSILKDTLELIILLAWFL